ncbi:MAG: hypothetical protein AB8B99_04600 [Phormidesmis sp.]
MNSDRLSEHIHDWFPHDCQKPLIEHLSRQVGLTRTRADYFIRLWVYLLAKQQLAKAQKETPQRPLKRLTLLSEAMSCSHREAAQLFYGDKEEGSDRAAGMMLDKLAALGLISKYFDGNTTRIEITLNPSKLQPQIALTKTEQSQPLILDDFNARCDAVPVANLLAINYGWMNRSVGRNLEIVPHRITRLLRSWANAYTTGMRVLRRSDNLNPVGFYLMYPVAPESEINFSSSPTKGLHLTSAGEIDPFTLATPGDINCTAVFIRSWMIDPDYLVQYRPIFLTDAQSTLLKMQQDFPNLCDLHTLIIHPSYEAMALSLGFQKMGRQTSRDTQIYWMYQALDRYLALKIPDIFL